MATQCDDRSRSRQPSKGRLKCDHCCKLGHKIDRFYALHGRPPRPIAMANFDPPPRSPSADHPTSSNTINNLALFQEFLRWYGDRQHSSSTTSTSVTHAQDRSSKHMIGTGCESHGLYHLRPSPHAGVIMESLSLLHARLRHPSVAKLQQLIPSLSKLSSLSCDSCQLGSSFNSTPSGL
ncbi:uncharacterized protein LOC111241687 isoform X2 [Vigna radiata var. radiata]|uniref:Uncharacterized protein LOC111241687 isoform X2 n=1 Tax=Vigna radiata var. radiata TaxID=3916 RepID=A0A3Q0EYT4_VIGRR|nr:uncharacterized protein LOC111241687 isoform X2 [Vigna radiata var. radiata]